MERLLVHQLATAHAALADLSANPELLPTCRKAVRGFLSGLQTVESRQRRAVLSVVPPRAAASVVDFRERQLPVGDRDREGYGNDAA